MDAEPMDVEGVTNSVENVVSTVGGTAGADCQVRDEADVYDMVDASFMQAPAAKLLEQGIEVCIPSLLSCT